MKLSTSLTLLRPGPNGLEVFWARRRNERAFLGGFHAFFAGSVEDDDRDLKSAALRECFEESGLLFTAEGILRFPKPDRTEERFHQALPSMKTSMPRLHSFGWWATPEWLSPAFTTLFFGLILSREEGLALEDLAEGLDQDEFATGTWISLPRALEAWRRGEAYLSSPISELLRHLHDHPPQMPLPAPLGPSQEQPFSDGLIEFIQGLVVMPLPTLTLPPATHTNCVILGTKRFLIIDPGPSDPALLAPLIELVERRIQDGDRPLALLATHHHGDHVGGLALLAKHFELPILGHPETLSRLSFPGLTTREVHHGDEFEIDEPGPARALHTPGHAPGHLAIYLKEPEVLLAADLVASRGTIIIDPPEGNMGRYLASLEEARSLQARALLPSHGQLIVDPDAHLQGYIAHRLHREELIFQALSHQGPSTARDLIPLAYPEIPSHVWPLAERSLLAHLEHLAEAGRIHRQGDLFLPP